jgi:diaminohydroxyphosphoribosylaminopyrimidine deaminase/5-amino-6-(5-phosphoribosylamino)uracil reductase
MNPSDTTWMQRALELAARGQGSVEPNPMVGCVIVCEEQIIGQGWHAKFGGTHAEIAALSAVQESVRGATMYVTLEPCCHHGKTPPCSQAVIDAGIARVVIAMRDPFPQVDGGGVAQLEQAGIAVEVGLLEQEARALNAPYLKRVATGRPWMIAKWAMTLDGKIATHTGHSQWISNEPSRAVVHAIRGRVDAIMVGRRTAELDDPQLTARPPGARTATRIVVDSAATLSPDSKLVKTASQIPVLIATSAAAPAENRTPLEAVGCEVLVLDGASHAERLEQLLDELGRRSMTNVLVEGGGQLLGSLWDIDQIDEAHAFIAPKLVGGSAAASPLAGEGLAQIPVDATLVDSQTQILGSDIYIHGRIRRNSSNPG